MAVTPNRRTIVEIDADSWMTSDPPFIAEYEMERISRSAVTPEADVLFESSVGWRLAMVNETISIVHERADADDGVLTKDSGRMFTESPGVASKGVVEEPVNQESGAGMWGIPGVPAYTGGRAARTGDRFMRVEFGRDGTATNAAGGPLDTDQSADPALSAANTVPAIAPTVPLDRIALSTANHLPNQSIAVRFNLPLVPLGATDLVLSVQFTGIASRGRDATLRTVVQGDGIYRLAVYGDGRAVLYERAASATSPKAWHERMRFRWFIPGTNRTAHAGYITSDARLVSGKWVGSVINFHIGDAMGYLDAVVASVEPRAQAMRTVTYRIPTGQVDAQAVQPVKIDIRRDTAALFQIARSLYRASGTLRTDTVQLPSLTVADGDRELQAYYCGVIPEGTTLDIAVYNAANDTALSASGVLSGYPGLSGGRTFVVPDGISQVYSILTFTSNGERTLTPFVRKIGYYRPGAIVEYAPDVIVPERVLSVSVSGQSADITTETARIVTADLGLDQQALGLRCGMPVRVKTRYDPSDPNAYSVLFQGYVVSAKKLVKGTKYPTRGFNMLPRAFPLYEGATQYRTPSRWGTIEATCLGEWKRLGEILTTRSFDFNIDPNAPPDEKGNQRPYKITHIIRTLLENAGYPDAMIDVPDLPMRLWGNPDPGKGLFVEQYTPVAPLIASMARDYLGMFLVFDNNASNGGGASDFRGCWRLKASPRAPFNQLAEFVTEPNWEGTAGGGGGEEEPVPHYRRSVNLDAYEPGTNDKGHEMPRAWMRKGTLREWVQPPECNRVFVTGVGKPSDGALKGGDSAEVRLMAQLTNWVSADFGQGLGGGLPAPNSMHPDYLGYIVELYYCDPGLTSQDAVNFVTRRIYDMACHGVQWRQFEAPLVLVSDEEDALQLRPRKLQFGDMVIVDGKTFVVNAVHVDYEGLRGGDRFQMAAYEVFAPPSLHNYTVLGAKDAVGPAFLMLGMYA